MKRPVARASRPLQLPGVELGAGAPTALSRATARQQDRSEAPAPMPWHCVVLAVDTAALSGWSVRVAGRQAEFGEVDTLDTAAVSHIVRWAVRKADRVRMPLVLVLEAPWGGKPWVLVALGQARERWLYAWRLAEQPAAKVVRVKPNVWRGPVLGRRFVGAKRAEVRAQEQTIASAMVGEPVGGDEAAALLIGRWAERSAKVGQVIGTKARAASLRAWTGRP